MIWTLVKFVANKTSEKALLILIEIAGFMNDQDLLIASDYLLAVRANRLAKSPE